MKAQQFYTLYSEIYKGLVFSQLQEKFLKEVNEMAEKILMFLCHLVRKIHMPFIYLYWKYISSY